MNKCSARELRNRLAPLATIAVTFATITGVPAAMAMVAAAGGTGAHQTQAAWTDGAASVRRDRHPPIGPRDDRHYFATGYKVNTVQLAARAPRSEIR